MKQHKIGLVKDILWYLKGAIELRAIFEIKDPHMIALKEMIEESQIKES